MKYLLLYLGLGLILFASFLLETASNKRENKRERRRLERYEQLIHSSSKKQ